MQRVLIAAFSTGWLLPMWVAGSTFLNFIQVEAWPAWRGEHPVNSFPFIRFTSQSFAFACAWLAVVVAWWAWRLASFPHVPAAATKIGTEESR
jgi:hypothetical protein